MKKKKNNSKTNETVAHTTCEVFTFNKKTFESYCNLLRDVFDMLEFILSKYFISFSDPLRSNNGTIAETDVVFSTYVISSI